MEKGKKYTLEVRFQTAMKVKCGTQGYTDVLCSDGTLFQFFDSCQGTTFNSDRTSVTQGQFPSLLYSRLRREPTEPLQEPKSSLPCLSFNYASIELSLSLTDGNFSKLTDELKLHRFMFSLLVEKTGNNLTVALQCRPIANWDEWTLKTETKTRLAFSKDHDKSEACTTGSTFSNASKSSELLSIRPDSLQLSDQHQTIILATVVRYDKRNLMSQVSRAEPPDFTKPWKDSDIVVAFDDGRELNCHKTILTLASPVLDRMLNLEFKEKQEKTIMLMDKSCDSFEKLLHLIYPRANSVTLDEDTAFELIEMFHEYDIAVLEQKAEAVLTKKASKTTALKYICVASRCGFGDLTERCLEIAVTMSPKEVKGDIAYYRLDDEARSLLQDARLRHANLD